MKFLILGCNGMAGHMVSLYLKEQGHEVIGFARKKSNFVETIMGDAHDKEYVAQIIKTGRYNCVVNCIGILNQNAEDNKADAVYLNSYLPHFLSDITHGTNTQVIHISTDCVFSGRRGQYEEEDFKDGETFYDRSKALGEIDNDKDFTIRTSIVGPDLNSNGIGLLNWFLQQKESVIGYTKVIWTGMTTLQLAKMIEKISMDKVHGLCNVVPQEAISKYELLSLFKKYLREDEIDVIPSESHIIDKSLKRTKFCNDFVVPGYEMMLVELKEWMKRHKNLYPQYALQ